MRYYNNKELNMAFGTMLALKTGFKNIMPKEVSDVLRLVRRDHRVSSSRIKRELGWSGNGNFGHVTSVMEGLGLISRANKRGNEIIWEAV